jgi:hypothetical protein
VSTPTTEPTEPELPEPVENLEIGQPINLSGVIQTLERPSFGLVETSNIWIRSALAIAFGMIFAAVLLLPLLFIDGWAQAKEWFQAALPAITGLLGSAIGFYFARTGNTNNTSNS